MDARNTDRSHTKFLPLRILQVNKGDWHVILDDISSGNREHFLLGEGPQWERSL